MYTINAPVMADMKAVAAAHIAEVPRSVRFARALVAWGWLCVIGGFGGVLFIVNRIRDGSP
jgi:hypothetical protein